MLKNIVWSSYEAVWNTGASAGANGGVWAASGFKGADGTDGDLVPVQARVANHINWLKLASLTTIRGFIVTGFARDEHWGPLKENLAAGLPALALCLRVLAEGRYTDELRNQTLSMLGMPLDVPLAGVKENPGIFSSVGGEDVEAGLTALVGGATGTGGGDRDENTDSGTGALDRNTDGSSSGPDGQRRLLAAAASPPPERLEEAQTRTQIGPAERSLASLGEEVVDKPALWQLGGVREFGYISQDGDNLPDNDYQYQFPGQEAYRLAERLEVSTNFLLLLCVF